MIIQHETGLSSAAFARDLIVREIAGELAKAGFVTGTGKPYAAAAIAKMIEA